MGTHSQYDHPSELTRTTMTDVSTSQSRLPIVAKKPYRKRKPPKRSKAGGKFKATLRQFKAALVAFDGNCSAVADHLNMTAQGVSKRIRENVDLQEFVANLDEEVNNLAEDVVVQALRAGDVATARWRLDRKAKHRGYGFKVDRTGEELPVIVDAVAEARRFETLRLIGQIMEDRARAGLPPLFPDDDKPEPLVINQLPQSRQPQSKR